MSKKTIMLTASSIGLLLLLLAIVMAVVLAGFPGGQQVNQPGVVSEYQYTTARAGEPLTQNVGLLPFTHADVSESQLQVAPRPPGESLFEEGTGLLTELYRQSNPGVVSVQVQFTQERLTRQGSGSGFIVDEDGHIVTNDHVVAGASRVTVVFYNGIEAEAEIVGADAHSDLAVLRVRELEEGVHPLPLGDSNRVEPGEWVVAIGNPFQFGGSMTLGIVSAVGRALPSGATSFSIPQAIQTDAAINPGNSGGPLLNLSGEVIGVNAQIRSATVQANSGVGFAIPSNVVGLVAPGLIAEGTYTWPWLGIRGGDVNLAIMRANNLDSQRGAYIEGVIPGGPAARARLRGTSQTRTVQGVEVPVGGDVVVAVDGAPILDFNDLLVRTAFNAPGDTLALTILRDGERRQVTAILAPRPDS